MASTILCFGCSKSAKKPVAQPPAAKPAPEKAAAEKPVEVPPVTSAPKPAEAPPVAQPAAEAPPPAPPPLETPAPAPETPEVLSPPTSPAPAPTAPSTESTQPQIGDRVRIDLTSGQSLEGTLVQLLSDSIAINVDGADTQTVFRPNIQKMTILNQASEVGPPAESDTPEASVDSGPTSQPQIGDRVEVNMSDGNSFKGVLREVLADSYIVDIDGGDTQTIYKNDLQSIKKIP